VLAERITPSSPSDYGEPWLIGVDRVRRLMERPPKQRTDCDASAHAFETAAAVRLFLFLLLLGLALGLVF
jgi:hypothetical protein